MSDIVSILLCFCDEESAFWLLIQLLEKILIDFYAVGRGRNFIGMLIEKCIIKKLTEKYIDSEIIQENF